MPVCYLRPVGTLDQISYTACGNSYDRNPSTADWKRVTCRDCLKRRHAMTFRSQDNRKLLLEFMEFLFPEGQKDAQPLNHKSLFVDEPRAERLVDEFLKKKEIK
jgi:hypothetical protein